MIMLTLAPCALCYFTGCAHVIQRIRRDRASCAMIRHAIIIAAVVNADERHAAAPMRIAETPRCALPMPPDAMPRSRYAIALALRVIRDARDAMRLLRDDASARRAVLPLLLLYIRLRRRVARFIFFRRCAFRHCERRLIRADITLFAVAADYD